MSGATRFAEKLVALDRRRGVQNVFAGSRFQAAASTTSTTNTSTYVDALVWVWDELPDGIYVIDVDGSMLLSHSAAGQVDFQFVCGTDSFFTTLAVPTVRERIAIAGVFLDVEVANGAGITLKLQYKNDEDDPGTAAARNPAMRALAIKVG